MFTWEIELRIERSRRMKISFQIETRFRFLYRQSYFLGDFSTYTFKYVNKTSHFSNNLYFGHNERRFHSEFHSRVKFQSKFTWFPIDISFRIECSIRSEKWNELDPEWIATQSGFMFKKYKTFSVLISTRVEIEKKREIVLETRRPQGGVFSHNFEFFQFSRVLI